MNINNLVPAKSLAQRNGVKMIAYGPPGTGKTPVLNSAPNPVCLICEPGMMTMKDSNIPCFYAPTRDKIKEFFEWALKSAEVKRFDTICIDSGSEMAETDLKYQHTKNSHGLKAYGEMTEEIVNWLDGLYYMPEKHIYIICKQTFIETITNTFTPAGIPLIQTSRKAAPYWPGKELPMKVSHKFDLLAQTNRGDVPGVQGKQLYFKCVDDNETTARDRSGFLTQYEPLDLGALFRKAMQ